MNPNGRTDLDGLRVALDVMAVFEKHGYGGGDTLHRREAADLITLVAEIFAGARDHLPGSVMNGGGWISGPMRS